MKSNLNINSTSSPSQEETNFKDGGFTRVPNSILKAADLNSDAKVALALLIEVYHYAENTNQLGDDGSIYFPNKRFEEHMDLTGNHVVSKVIPELEQRGLLSSFNLRAGAKTHKHYVLDWEAINNYDGSHKDASKQDVKSLKGKKAYECRKAKEDAVVARYLPLVQNILNTPYTSAERDLKMLSIQKELRSNGYKIATIRTLFKRMIKVAQSKPTESPAPIIPKSTTPTVDVPDVNTEEGRALLAKKMGWDIYENPNVTYEDGTAIEDCFDDDDEDDDEDSLY